MGNNDKFDVFLCHNSADKPFVFVYSAPEQTELFRGVLCVSAPLREITGPPRCLSLAETQRRKEREAQFMTVDSISERVFQKKRMDSDNPVIVFLHLSG